MRKLGNACLLGLFVLEIVSLGLGDKNAFPLGTGRVTLVAGSYTCFRGKNRGRTERPPASVVLRFPQFKIFILPTCHILGQQF